MQQQQEELISSWTDIIHKSAFSILDLTAHVTSKNQKWQNSGYINPVIVLRVQLIQLIQLYCQVNSLQQFWSAQIGKQYLRTQKHHCKCLTACPNNIKSLHKYKLILTILIPKTIKLFHKH